MSINEIKLQPGQLADLYGQLLVETEGQSSPTAEPIIPPMLGDFSKKVLILVNDPEHAYLSDAGMKLLTGILGACGLSMADVGILNLNNGSNLSGVAIQEKFKPSAWWIFGVDTNSLGMGVMNNPDQTHSFQQVPVFWSPSLKTLDSDPNSKRSLWGQLKKHYAA